MSSIFLLGTNEYIYKQIQMILNTVAWFQVSIHYTGKLKTNGEIYDFSTGRRPLKFRLGTPVFSCDLK